MTIGHRFLISCILLVGSNIQAQEGWMIGLAPTTAPAPSLIGGNARAYFGVDPRFCFGPEVSVFPYQDVDDQYELSLIELNLNAHYLFELVHRFGVYPLGGFNYSIEQERLLTDIDEVDKHNALGLNYGLGVHYNINQVLLFAEFKGVVSELSDEFFTLGVVVLLQKSSPASRHNN